MTGPTEARDSPPVDLSGMTVAITASRRADDTALALTRRGARTILAPTMCSAPLDDDAGLIRATQNVIENPPDFLLATTAVGFRGWLDAADALGVGDDLRRVLGNLRIITRGPKVTGAVRAAGLHEEWSASTETTMEALRWLAASGGRDSRVAVQLHGDPDPEWLPLLRDFASEVATVPVYRWLPAPDPHAVQGLIKAILARDVDAIVFTSAPAVEGLFSAITGQDTYDDLVDALREDVLVAAVGPVTAQPLEALGITSVQPARARLGALNRILIDELASRRMTMDLGPGLALTLSGSRATVGHRSINLTPTGRRLLHSLASARGAVVSRGELRTALVENSKSDQALAMAISRLRAALLEFDIIETVPQRGYRLAVNLVATEKSADAAILAQPLDVVLNRPAPAPAPART